MGRTDDADNRPDHPGIGAVGHGVGWGRGGKETAVAWSLAIVVRAQLALPSQRSTRHQWLQHISKEEGWNVTKGLEHLWRLHLVEQHACVAEQVPGGRVVAGIHDDVIPGQKGQGVARQHPHSMRLDHHQGIQSAGMRCGVWEWKCTRGRRSVLTEPCTSQCGWSDAAPGGMEVLWWRAGAWRVRHLAMQIAAIHHVVVHDP